VSLFRMLADNRDPRSLAARLRRRRSLLLRELLATVPRPARVLDIGGTQTWWDTIGAEGLHGLTIVLVNPKAQQVTRAGFEAIVGDGRALALPDRSFDIVFSNSVIEHVGDLDDQRRMAAEIQRVGRRYYVQTPNRWFPIEPHFVFPAFQFLPLAVRTELLMRFRLGWFPKISERAEARRVASSIRLLTEAELRDLFPGATLHRESFAGLTKSLIVTRGFSG